MKLEASSHSDSTPWKEGGKVTVQVVKEIAAGASPLEVSEAWMEHHWRRGGGLPIFVSTLSSPDSSSTETKRTIYPIAMKERILSSEDIADDDTVPVMIRYQVFESGPFFADLVPGSHQATVTFSKDKMIWKVEFETTRLRALYQAAAEFTVGVAARTVQEASGRTRLLTLKATIPRHTATTIESQEVKSKEALSIIALRRELLDFFWARGGGLPLPNPIPYGDLLEDGGGMARSKLLRVPPLITESIVSTDSFESDDKREEAVADIVYRLEEPGWLTFPFLLHTHLGRIQLSSPSSSDNTGPVELQWQVEIRSYPLVSPVVEKLVDMTICTIVRNFLVHLEEPGATVPLMISAGKLPSQSNDSHLSMSIDIPRASWWGGVIEKLNAEVGQQEQDRDLKDRVFRVFTPWAWGRTGSGNENDDVVSYCWADDGKIKL